MKSRGIISSIPTTNLIKVTFIIITLIIDLYSLREIRIK